uniref:Uncharacterized protein n=1 Tax=viral metagenome TaxID=1070528 RepID=A0A6H1ZKH7_9ZZZZ
MESKKRIFRKKAKWIIEIKSNAKGWYRVELLKIKNNGMLIIKLPSGEIIGRHASKSTRYGKTVLKPSGKPNKKDLKHFRTKKQKRKYLKGNKKFKKVLVDKWK